MAPPRDIRSFFTRSRPAATDDDAPSDPPAKKPRLQATTTTNNHNKSDSHSDDDEENATDANTTTVAPDAEREAAANANANSDANTDANADAPEPLPHTLANLAHNARFLMHASWFEQLEGEFSRPYFTRLVRFLASEEAKKKVIYPPPPLVFAALRDCAFSSLRVVILGQDPYHGPGQAHGLSFSVLPGIATPPSLRNIYMEAMSDVGIARPTHGCLTSWSRQGVLLLNTVLTVPRGDPNKHKNQGWEQLTDAVLRAVSQHAEHVVFLLWGKPAQMKRALVDTSRHLVLMSSHPSPLGATKTNAPFIGSRCFSRANAYLETHGKPAIDWAVELTS